MRNAFAGALALAMALGCDGGKWESFTMKDASTSPPERPRESHDPSVARHEDPTPVTDACHATCARIEAAGPVVELLPPTTSSLAEAVVTYGKGRWYAAWSNGPSTGTRIQRFTGDGRPDGPTRFVDAVRADGIVWNPRGDGELNMFATSTPPYSPAKGVLARFDPNLAPVGTPFAVEEAFAMRSASPSLIATADGAIERTNSFARAEALVRILRVDPAGGAAQTPVQHDWFIHGKTSQVLAQNLPGKRAVAIVANGVVRTAELLADGALGQAHPVTNLPAGNLYGALVGKTWWLMSVAQPPTRAVSLRAIDPVTLEGVGEPIHLSWPTGSPHALVDANGTLAILGNLEEGAPSRVSIVPIDVPARAACRPSTLKLASPPHASQWYHDVHVEGDTMGIALTSERDQTKQTFFTRLACTRPAP